jgi:hypothetical protein
MKARSISILVLRERRSTESPSSVAHSPGHSACSIQTISLSPASICFGHHGNTSQVSGLSTRRNGVPFSSDVRTQHPLPVLRLRLPAKGLSVQEPHEDEVMLCISRPLTGRLDASSVSSYEVYTPDMAVNIQCGKEKAPVYPLANLCHTTERPQNLLVEIY